MEICLSRDVPVNHAVSRVSFYYCRSLILLLHCFSRSRFPPLQNTGKIQQTLRFRRGILTKQSYRTAQPRWKNRAHLQDIWAVAFNKNSQLSDARRQQTPADVLLSGIIIVQQFSASATVHLEPVTGAGRWNLNSSDLRSRWALGQFRLQNHRRVFSTGLRRLNPIPSTNRNLEWKARSNQIHTLRHAPPLNAEPEKNHYPHLTVKHAGGSVSRVASRSRLTPSLWAIVRKIPFRIPFLLRFCVEQCKYTRYISVSGKKITLTPNLASPRYFPSLSPTPDVPRGFRDVTVFITFVLGGPTEMKRKQKTRRRKKSSFPRSRSARSVSDLFFFLPGWDVNRWRAAFLLRERCFYENSSAFLMLFWVP